MEIKKNTVVTFRYSLINEDGSMVGETETQETTIPKRSAYSEPVEPAVRRDLPPAQGVVEHRARALRARLPEDVRRAHRLLEREQHRGRGRDEARRAGERAISELELDESDEGLLEMRAEEAAAAKAKAIEVGLKQQAFIIHTEPKVPEVGKPLKVFYNKNNTHLNWSEEIYLTGGFNRWAHETAVAPMKMTPPTEGEEFFSATVPSVPSDAWICLLYTSPSPRDRTRSRMPSSA